jgi:predicted O-linked N-acetylglucosamine transferase (SPINDLY family)
MRSLEGRALRVGYVFADFSERTVGVLVKDVLASHNPDRVTVFAYSAGEVHDWVPEQIWSACLSWEKIKNQDSH